jgi:methylated-DNA-[protein]-cysteine S-methyltransferase
MSTVTEHFLTTAYESPIGELVLVGDGDALAAIHLPNRPPSPERRAGWTEDAAALAHAVGQLDEYFGGRRTEFDLPLRQAGTPFERAVWERVAAIPYGETASYGEIARALGRPDRARAVGAANGRNPLPIVVPCHRVIGSDGSLVGYGGGLERKRALLDLERSAREPRLY